MTLPHSSLGIDLKRIMKAALRLFLIIVSILILTACSNQPDAPSELGSDQDRGRVVYVANCASVKTLMGNIELELINYRE